MEPKVLSWPHTTGEGFDRIIIQIMSICTPDRCYFVFLSQDDNHTAFFVAAAAGHKDVAKLLLKKGEVHVDDVDIDGLTALDWALENKASMPEGCEEVSRAFQVWEGSPVVRMRLDFPTITVAVVETDDFPSKLSTPVPTR